MSYNRYNGAFDDVIERYRKIISNIYNKYYSNENINSIKYDINESKFKPTENNIKFILTLLYLYTDSNSGSDNINNLVSNIEEFLDINNITNIDYNSLICDSRFIEFLKDNYNMDAMLFYPLLNDKQLSYLNNIFNESLLEIL